jgi:hypothetical protein
MADLQAAILVIDEHLEEPSGKAGKAIKNLFGLGELENDEYVPRLCLRRLGVVRSRIISGRSFCSILSFAGVLSNPLGAWQARNWDPAVDSVQVRSLSLRALCMSTRL